MNVLEKVRFRDAIKADIPALIALVESAYRGDASRQGWTTEADLLDGQRIDRQGLEADLDAEQSRIILACDGDTILACAHIAVENGAGYFGMFSVRPELQGSGLGKYLMRYAESEVKQAFGMTVMRMTVIDIREELIAFYERRGYHRTGIKKPFPYGDARFGLPRRADLQFEVLEKVL